MPVVRRLLGPRHGGSGRYGDEVEKRAPEEVEQLGPHGNRIADADAETQGGAVGNELSRIAHVFCTT